MTVPAWQQLVARLRAWVRRARRVLAGAIAPAGEPFVPGGPPAHWVQKVRAGAPHLLEPARPYRAGHDGPLHAPTSGTVTASPSPPAARRWSVRPPARTAPVPVTEPAPARPHPRSRLLRRRPRRDVGAWAAAPPDDVIDAAPVVRRRASSIATVARRQRERRPEPPARRVPLSAPPPGAPPPAPRRTAGAPSGAVQVLRVIERVPTPPPAVGPAPPTLTWPELPPTAPTEAPAWPPTRPRSDLDPTYRRAPDRWPDLPAPSDDHRAGAVTAVDGLAPADRLRREHESGW